YHSRNWHAFTFAPVSMGFHDPELNSARATLKSGFDHQGESAMKILVLPGDGIGSEITEATLAVLDRANSKFKLGLEWQTMDMGMKTLKAQGSTLPEAVMDAARKAPGIILGPVDHLQYPSREQGGINPSGELRVKLDLFANIRPAVSRM